MLYGGHAGVKLYHLLYYYSSLVCLLVFWKFPLTHLVLKYSYFLSGLTPAVYAGNPGLLGFYATFLSAIHHKLEGDIAILAHAHLGHTPEIDASRVPQDASRLVAQVEGVVETLDAVISTYGAKPKIIVVGHSVGSWVALQVSRV